MVSNGIHRRGLGFILLQFMNQRLLENQVLLYLDTMYSVVAKLTTIQKILVQTDTAEILPPQ